MIKKKKKKAKCEPRDIRLYVKPKSPPAWWPKNAKGQPVFVGCYKNGCGWCLGDGDLLTKEEAEVAREVLGWEIEKPQFKEVSL
jgi:hypothetical protein